jgi:hypothetical protein
MHDVMLQSLKADLARMHARMSALESEVLQLRRAREAKVDLFRQVRWCITCEPEDEEEEYPASGTVFPIKFLDAHFEATAGDQDFESSDRSDVPTTVAFCAHYVPVNTPCPVFWLRGLGGADAGEWWLLDLTVEWHRGVTDEAMNKGATKPVSRYTDGTDADSGLTDQVHNDFINVGAGKIVIYVKIGGVYYLVAVECPPT